MKEMREKDGGKMTKRSLMEKKNSQGKEREREKEKEKKKMQMMKKNDEGERQ